MEVRNKLREEKKKIIGELLNQNADLYKESFVKYGIRTFLDGGMDDLSDEEVSKIYEALPKDVISKIDEIFDINNIKDHLNEITRFDTKYQDLLSSLEENTRETKQKIKSFTDSIQVLLFLEKQTNDKLSDLEKKYISEIETALLNGEFNTNNLLRAKMNEINSSNEYQSISFELKKNIQKVCELENFKSNNERFLNIDRTKENDRMYKEKNELGYIKVCELSDIYDDTNIAIKRILKPSEQNSQKYYNMNIVKNAEDKMNEELYKSELMKLISPEDYSKARKIDRNKLSVKILSDFESYASNSKINSDRSLVRNVLIAYIAKITDRHHENMSSDLRYIDFGTPEDFKKYRDDSQNKALFYGATEKKDFTSLKSELTNYMGRNYYPKTLVDKFKNINVDEFEKCFNDVMSELKGRVDNNKDNLNNLIQEYKQEAGEDLMLQPEKYLQYIDYKEVKSKEKRIE